MNEFNPNAVKRILIDMLSYGLVDGYRMPLDDEMYLLEIYNQLKTIPFEGIHKKYNMYFEEEIVNNN